MTITLEGVPATITRSELVDWLAAIGIDANDVPRGATLTLGPTAISIELHARDENGQRFLAPDRQRRA